MLECLPLVSVSNDCRCHLVRHQHRNDNVVKTTLSSSHDLASPSTECCRDKRPVDYLALNRILNRAIVDNILHTHKLGQP